MQIAIVTAENSQWLGWDGGPDLRGGLPAPWVIQHKELQLELSLTPSGHVGLFPEQAINWDWLSRQLAGRKESLKILNLFAYTGGSTLAAAAAGAEVVHVDAARNTIAWARRNATQSGLQDAPIRWISSAEWSISDSPCASWSRPMAKTTSAAPTLSQINNSH